MYAALYSGFDWKQSTFVEIPQISMGHRLEEPRRVASSGSLSTMSWCELRITVVSSTLRIDLATGSVTLRLMLNRVVLQ